MLDEANWTSEERNQDKRETFLEELAGYFGDPLFAKLVTAYFLEGDVANGDAESNGILGRAIDQAIEVLLPCASHDSGWYRSAVAPKL